MTVEAQLNPKPRLVDKHRTLLLAFAAFIVVFALWQTDQSSNLLYPFRLMVTFIHETGHGLTAIATGGQFQQFQVDSSGAGLAYTASGSSFLVPQMGYLGAALFGALLLFAANRYTRVNWLAIALGAYFAMSALLFSNAGPIALIIGVLIAVGVGLFDGWLKRRTKLSILSGIPALIVLGVVWIGVPMVIRASHEALAGTTIALMVGIIDGLMLIALGLFAPRAIIIFMLNALAFITGLNALTDISYLWQIGDKVRSDASAMTNVVPGLPVQFWVLLWVGLAVVMMSISVYFTFIRPMRRSAT